MSQAGAEPVIAEDRRPGRVEEPGPRRLGRECALHLLYAWDGVAPTVDALQRGMDEYWLSFDAPPDGRPFAEELVRGVLAEREAVDGVIREASERWRMERMARVDRTVLRVAVHELRAHPDTPAVVVIDEAVELARLYSTSEAPAFVNGLLDKIARRLGRL